MDKKKLAKKQQQQAQQTNGSHEPSPVSEDSVPELATEEATPTEGERGGDTGGFACFTGLAIMWVVEQHD